MATITPTVLATEPHSYREQMERLEPFATRLHIDMVDGAFAANQTVGFDQIWWPANISIDMHVMYQRPADHLDAIIALKPRLVIVHAEADVDLVSFASNLHANGMQLGVALLADTPVSNIASQIGNIDHVLIFSGNLGQFGGAVDLGLLTKATALRELKSTLELGWDGGINDTNVAALVAGGIDVLNVGGFIQKSPDAEQAYQRLLKILHS